MAPRLPQLQRLRPSSQVRYLPKSKARPQYWITDEALALGHETTLIETDLDLISADLTLVGDGYNLTTVFSTSSGHAVTSIISDVVGTADQYSLQSIWAAKHSQGQASPTTSSESSSVSTRPTATKNSTGQVSTVFINNPPPSSNQATVTSTDTATAHAQSPTHRDIPTIAGVSVGVPLGLAAVALVSYILRQRRKNNAIHATAETQAFPPDPTSTSEAGTYQEAELDRQPKVHAATELDAQPNMLAELEGPLAELDGKHEISMSATSELDAATAVLAPVAPDGQVVDQQQQDAHGGSEAPHSTDFNLPKRIPGIQPAIEATMSETPTSPRCDEGVIDSGEARKTTGAGSDRDEVVQEDASKRKQASQ